MNNDQLLEQIGKVIDERLDVKLEPIKSDIADLKQGQTRLEQGQKEQGSAIARLEQGQARLEQRINSVEENLSKKIQEQGEHLTDFIIHTATEILKEQDQRISNIEDHLGLTNPTKN
jgi:chromosome segregation ATPase